MSDTDEASSKTKRHLPMFGAAPPSAARSSGLDQALEGAASPALIRRVLATAIELSRETVTGCVAPSGSAPLLELLTSLDNAPLGVASKSNLRSVQRALSRAAGAARDQTLRAIDQALERGPSFTPSLIDVHADAVVRRHVALAVTHATTTVSLVAEGTANALALSELPFQAGGALAYRSTALGLARDPSFRERVCEHARWEHELPTSPGASPGALAVQLYHEYLGAHWREHADAHRLAFEARLLACLS